MSLLDQINAAATRMLIAQGEILEGEKVVYIEEDIRYSGGCETCAYDEYIVEYNIERPNGRLNYTVTGYTKFGDLIQRLEDYS